MLCLGKSIAKEENERFPILYIPYRKKVYSSCCLYNKATKTRIYVAIFTYYHIPSEDYETTKSADVKYEVASN